MKPIVRRFAALVLACATIVPMTYAHGAYTKNTQPTRGVFTYDQTIAPQYQSAQPFSDGLAAVMLRDRWGYIDETGTSVIPHLYHVAYPYSEGHAIVGALRQVDKTDPDSEKRLELGFIDQMGTYTPFQIYLGDTLVNYAIRPDQFDQDTARFFYGGYVLLPLPDQTGTATQSALFSLDALPIATKSGMVPTALPTEGLVASHTPGVDMGAGYTDVTGKVVLAFDKPTYFGATQTDEFGTIQNFSYISQVFPFHRGLAPVIQTTVDALNGYTTSQSLGFINTQGKWVIAPSYDNYYVVNPDYQHAVFGETGLAMVSKGGAFGAISQSGAVKIPFQYDLLLPFSEGLAVYQQDGHLGYLNSSLQTIVPPTFVQATGFSNGYAVVYDGERAYFIDKNGVEIQGTDALDPDTYFKENGDGTVTTFLPDEMAVIQESGNYGYGTLSYLPPLPSAALMSSWAFDQVTDAVEENLVPVHLQNLYTSQITRSEFSTLAVTLVEEMTGEDIKDVVLTQTGQDFYQWVGCYPFTDCFDYDVVAAYALGIVSGRGNGIFDPYATITRQEAAAFLTRTAALLGLDTDSAPSTTFHDSHQVGSWFTQSVDFVADSGIMGDTGNHNFSPLSPYTREQSYVTVHRLFDTVRNTPLK